MWNYTNQTEESQTTVDTGNTGTVKKRLSPYLLLAAALFAMSLIWGLLMNPVFTGSMLEDLAQSLLPFGSLPPAALFAIIFLNNTIKSLLAIVLGIAMGIPSLIFLCFNGFTIGAIVAALQSKVNTTLIIASLAPHGIIEIPALIFATALGFSVGLESIKFLVHRQSHVKTQLRQSLIMYAKWILIMLFIAALIETFATPLLVSHLGGMELPAP